MNNNNNNNKQTKQVWTVSSHLPHHKATHTPQTDIYRAKQSALSRSPASQMVYI